MSERTLFERPVDIRGHKYIRLKSGRLVGFHDCMDEAERARTDLSRAVSRAAKLAAAHVDPELGSYELRDVERFVGDLHSYVHAVEAHLVNLRGAEAKRTRIAQLRDTTGRTDAEAAEYRRKADELEASL